MPHQFENTPAMASTQKRQKRKLCVSLSLICVYMCMCISLELADVHTILKTLPQWSTDILQVDNKKMPDHNPITKGAYLFNFAMNIWRYVIITN